jgi:Type VI secretion system/phage-baseplate injector OB domain
MSQEKFFNMIRMQASINANARTLTSIGIVTGYDPDNYLVTVEIYPQDTDNEALQTGWIPLFTPWIGNGWGMYAPPNIGDLIEIHYQEGSLQNPYAGLRTFNFNSPANPNSVQSGEFWLVHSTGSYFKLTNDGKISFNSTVEIDIGDNSNTLYALINSTFEDLFNNHVHTGGTLAGGLTGVSTTRIVSTNLTTVLKAN